MKQSNYFLRTLPLVLCAILWSAAAYSQNEPFQMRQVACGLSQPWEVTWGPDQFLWVTEAHSYEVTRINPENGSSQLLIDLSGMKNFPDTLDPFPQGGLMGLALHPQLLEGQPWVYLAYVHQFEGCLPGNGGCYFRTKIARYTYDSLTHTLSNEEVIIDTLPGSSDHNGGRLAIETSEGADHLFYTIGDMGAGHLMNQDRPHHGQDLNYYEGKILRFNLAPDGDAGAIERWIPNDNPFNEAGAQSAVWSLGHRNPQGLAFGETGLLYESEHGPYSDDEVNLILPGMNYGFPLVMGFADGNYDGSAAGAGSGVPLIASEEGNVQLIELNYPYMDPLESLFAASQSEVSTIYNNDKNETPPIDNYYLSWPSVAPSGIEFYGSDAIPGWQNSLLVTTLKAAKVYRLKLSADGQSITGDTVSYFNGMGRFRDIAIHPDGLKIFVSTDSMGQIAGPPGIALQPPNKGCILEFEFMTTGVEEDFLQNSVKVFPNPIGQESLNLDLGGLASASSLQVTITNLLGSKVFEQQLPADRSQQVVELDVSGLEAGHYFLSLEAGDGNVQQPRIVKKVVVLR